MNIASRPKNFQYMALIAIIVGIILAIYPERALSSVIIIIGAMLILSSVASIMDYYRLKRRAMEPSDSMIFNGVVSVVVGVILVMSPLFFIGFILTILAILLLVGSIGQLITLGYSKRKGTTIPVYLFIIPLILLILSVIMLAAPIESATTVTSMLGYGIIIYAAMELISLYVLRK